MPVVRSQVVFHWRWIPRPCSVRGLPSDSDSRLRADLEALERLEVGEAPALERLEVGEAPAWKQLQESGRSIMPLSRNGGSGDLVWWLFQVRWLVIEVIRIFRFLCVTHLTGEVQRRVAKGAIIAQPAPECR